MASAKVKKVLTNVLKKMPGAMPSKKGKAKAKKAVKKKKAAMPALVPQGNAMMNGGY